jgi:NADH-quinone oxidoreductase subunit N
MNADTAGLLAALPEIFVLTMACVILLVDLYLPPRARAVSYTLAQLTLVVAAGLTPAPIAAVISSTACS